MRRTVMRATTARSIVAGFLAVAFLVGTSSRAGADGSETKQSVQAAQEDPMYAEGVKAIKRGDFRAAIRALETVVGKDERNADAYNWLAYSIRQTGDAGRAVPIYQKALAIDPKHKGAHEYIGEAYLALGDLAKAKEHLAVLNKLCFFSCEEYSDLKKAVQAYEASGGRIRPTSTRTP
jgi:tetratricopeptide (TPR) repeat protein